jgi:Flp pilus assembly protein TadD
VFFSRGRLVLAAALLLGSCARREPQAIQRLAILRFENLTPDPATDWIGRALAEVVTAELSGSNTIYAMPSLRLHALNQALGARPIGAPGISAEAPLAHAAGAKRLGYGEYAIVSGRLQVRLTIEDSGTRQLAQAPIEAAVEGADPIVAATTLARRISADARPYGTSSAAALEAYVRGLEANDNAAIRRYGEQAVAADPNFGSGYILLVESAIKQQDRAGAVAALEAAAARGPAIAEAARARLEIMGASLRSDIAAVERALNALTKATPLDPTVWKSLGDALTGQRQYAQAVAAYTRAFAIEPDDTAGLNQLGYVAAYAGNFDAAAAALRRYQSLRPADANPLDSLGDVNLLTGRLQEAERLYLEVHKKDPAFLNGASLYKAAMARLMTGDVAGADSIMGDKSGGADWLWLTGRRQEAFTKMSADAPKITHPDVKARAHAQLAVWGAILGNREEGARLGSQPAVVATQGSAATVAVSRFVTMPSAPAAEWAARADRVFPNGPANPLRDFALAYAYLLDGHFAAAIPHLRRIDARAGAAGDRSAAIELAWALIESGNIQEAAPLLRLNPVPGTDNSGAFVGLYFPRLFQLRAVVAEREGKADEARENRRIYAALGGK